MLPMNKLVQSVAGFISAREKQGEGVPAGPYDKCHEAQKNAIVLFANEMSEEYGELVSVDLVNSLIVTHFDLINKDKGPIV